MDINSAGIRFGVHRIKQSGAAFGACGGGDFDNRGGELFGAGAFAEIPGDTPSVAGDTLVVAGPTAASTGAPGISIKYASS